jgi:hypothetical protein
MNQKSLVPPRFAIAASPFLYDPDLPDHLYRTYARIAGLAWQKEVATERTYEKTPPLTVYELAVICNLSVRNTWRHIRDLGQRGLLTWEQKKGVQTRMIFYPVWPGNGVDARDSQDVADDPAGALPASQGAPEPESASETHQALAEFGVNILEPLARQVAALPRVTPELVRAWGANLLQRPGIHNLPGLLLHILQRHTEPPPEAKPAPVASSRQPGLLQPATAPDQTGLGSSTEKALDGAEGIEALPAELEGALRDLGWSGDDAWREVAGIASHDLDFVWAWVRYVEAHPNLGAGFLRAQLRGSTWPAHKKDAQERERERWREQWQSRENEDPLPRSTPSSREQAMARYGISPEMMQVWEKVQEELALQMTRATFDTWLSGALLLCVDGGRATIGVRHAHAVDWLKNRLDGVIQRTLARHLDRPVEELDVVLLQDGGGESA